VAVYPVGAEPDNGFLCRTATPQHGILVLNRNGMNNFVRQLTEGTELDIQGQIVHVSGGDEKHDGEQAWWFASSFRCLIVIVENRNIRAVVCRRRARSTADDRCDESVSE